MSSSCYSGGYDDRLCEFEDDDSSFDSGYEKSFETDATTPRRKLFFDDSGYFPDVAQPFATQMAPNGCHIDVDFKPILGAQTSTPTKQQTATTTPPKPKRKYAVGNNRVTRSRSPTQVQRIKKFRRMKANDRERNRMHTLNDALETLRVTLPTFPEETKLTKIETLRFAHNYIFAMKEILESDKHINLDLEKLQSFTLSGERITKELFEAIFVNPQPQHGMMMTAGFTSFDFYNSMRQYGQTQQAMTPSQYGNQNFSQEKYDLFKGTFDAAVTTPQQPAGHYQPGYAGQTESSMYRNNGSYSSNCSPTHPATTPNYHHSSSFYSQTPPWKDYSEMMVNSSSYGQFSAV